MIKLDNNIIESLAPNAAAAKNGSDLVKKGKFNNLQINADQDLIWGECVGSGKNPYKCSVDFVDENNPIGRCSCPSRQFPCKHALGLMYAYAGGNTFTTGEAAEDILSKREKNETKKQKKEEEKISLKEKAEKPKKINKAALTKKYTAQLQGIELAEKLFYNVLKNGIAALDNKERKELRKQIVELGNYYILGIQAAFTTLIDLANEEVNSTLLIEQLNRIGSILKKTRPYIQERIDNPELAPELDSSIEEQIGTVWKLTDLISFGLYEENTELVQLSFNSYYINSSMDVNNEGVWFDLKTSKIYRTFNYVPAKAKKYIKSDDTTFGVVQLSDLYIYPGDMNPRVRWEDSVNDSREVSKQDMTTILESAQGNYAEVVKAIKSNIKNPLNNKAPYALLSLEKAYMVGNDILLEDANGSIITLRNDQDSISIINTVESLKNILPNEVKGMGLLVMFNSDMTEGLLYAQPISLLTKDQIIRLLY